MTGRRIALTAALLAAGAVLGAGGVWHELSIRPPAPHAAEAADKDAPKADEKERQADRDAVQGAAEDFVKTFEKGDAKALAALWTEEGEYVAGDGVTLRGRAELEDGYSQFFKKNPDVKLEVMIESVRFVSHDGAVAEGARGRTRPARPESRHPAGSAPCTSGRTAGGSWPCCANGRTTARPSATWTG